MKKRVVGYSSDFCWVSFMRRPRLCLKGGWSPVPCLGWQLHGVFRTP